MSKSESDSKQAAAVEDDDDEPDDWDKRIFSTGCAGELILPRASVFQTHLLMIMFTAENTKMNDCYYEKKDWRLCKNELELFRQCWKQQQNDKRTGMKDA
ncbi:Cytochrome oxidase assembly factor [Lachnellula willkommii]|uniref:Cytochrome oxidase assembly factor n=1 Tax=Lachnellula willkommii TaxID=215461 RepID=A0A559M2W9_9HELO|nr:Cytochrome oxidase assembly factor [Lachnellula willkommii]